MRINKFWSKIYNILKVTDNQSLINRILNRIRDWKIKNVKEYTDLPLVETELNGRKIVVPLAHNLVFYKKIYSDYDQHIVSICKYVISKLGYLKFIDVGANVGDTLINLNINQNAEYLCIEGDPYFYSLMNWNLGKYAYKYKAVNCILKDKSTMGGYAIEHSISSARLVESQEDNVQNGDTLDNVVFRENFELNVLKIDTDGFDLKVLRGSRQILERYNPVIFFEWYGRWLRKLGENPETIFEYLNELGYEECVLFDNYGTIIATLKTSDKINIKLMMEYSCNTEKQIYYYDVLLFHKDSSLNVTDFLESINIVKNFNGRD